MSDSGRGRVPPVPVMHLVRDAHDREGVALVESPSDSHEAVELGTDGLIALGSHAGRTGLVVARVDLRTVSGAASGTAEEAAELAMVEAMRDGHSDVARALLSDEGLGYYIATIALADRGTGQRLTVSRYGDVVVGNEADLTSRVRSALLQLVATTTDDGDE
jgi:hypothetical protein